MANREPDHYVRYLGHATPGVVLADDGSLIAMLQFGGVCSETADADEIAGWHGQLNNVLRNVARDRVVLTSHVIRSLANEANYSHAKCRTDFGQALDSSYRKRLFTNRLYNNGLFLTVHLRQPQPAGRSISNILNRRQRGDLSRQASAQDIDEIETVVGNLTADLEPYQPQRLGLRVWRGIHFSEIGEAFHYILTGNRIAVPLVSGHLGGAIYTDRVIVGRETIEIRRAGSSSYAAAFGLREYPAWTWPGMFDRMLAAPYRCVLTQSFGFVAKQTGHDILTRKQNQMVAASDKAASQADALTEAADQLQGNDFVMGDHHLSLLVFADSLTGLAEAANAARHDLADCGAVIVREDLGLEAAYWAQLPGNERLRVRPAFITSRNFAAMSSLHNYPSGPAVGHWGEPVTLFRTAGGTPYQFHLHATTPQVADVANIFLCGPAGSGKTTLLLFLLAMSERLGAQVIFFDKDRGGEIFTRAVGGIYLTLPAGTASGLAPLKGLDASKKSIEFLDELIRGLLAIDGVTLGADDQRRLHQGLTAVMGLDPKDRSLGEVRAFLGQGAAGPGAHLEKWCAGGALGWVLDNAEDHVGLDLPFLGFDMTAVLDNAMIRGPIMAYLFHRLDEVNDGRRLVIAIDEFWKALADPAFSALVDNKLRTIRKRNGAVILSTQSPADALQSPIARVIIDQCPTQILMPNARADERDYIAGLKLTKPEFQVIHELSGGSHQFLLKQGPASVVCELDLSGPGMADLVAILSGRTATVRLMDELIKEYGPDPEQWLPAFRRRWREAKA